MVRSRERGGVELVRCVCWYSLDDMRSHFDAEFEDDTEVFKASTAEVSEVSVLRYLSTVLKYLNTDLKFIPQIPQYRPQIYTSDTSVSFSNPASKLKAELEHRGLTLNEKCKENSDKLADITTRGYETSGETDWGSIISDDPETA
ncbi:hypothetical protein E4U09_005390, partial [Claviceps aff. purpurea]